MVTPRDFWNTRAGDYDSTSGVTYARANRDTAALSLKRLGPGDRVLDFACGTGAITALIAPHVGQVRAIDISDRMAARAKARFDALGLDNIQVSRTGLFDPSLEEGSFHGVLAFNVLCYVRDRPAVLGRLRALLAPGGVFLSATDCLGEGVTRAGLKKFWRSHTGSMPYVAFLTRKRLEREIAAAGFDILERANLFPAPPNLFVAARKTGDGAYSRL